MIGLPRNKHPEETVNRILDTAVKLFIGEGYENTTIQDIINGIGDLTKGAIYHHFKSKEDILLAAMERLTGGQEQSLASIVHEKGLTGLEKLRKIIHTSVAEPGQEKLFGAAPKLQDNPHVLVLLMQESVDVSAPLFILPIIEEGIADGSIQTKYPEELAEAIMLLVNLWINPMVFPVDSDKLKRKLRFVNYMAEHLGIPELMDEETIHRLENYHLIFEKKHTNV